MRNRGKQIFSTGSARGQGTSVECVCGGGYTCKGWWRGSIVPNNATVDCSCCNNLLSDSTK